MNTNYAIKWTPQAWEDFKYLAKYEKRLAKKVLALLEELKTDPFKGNGKLEPLKYALSGCCSRRIDWANRLVYEIRDTTVYILST